MSNSERNLETLPTGSLGIIPLQSCQELGEKVDKYLVKWRDERQHQHQNDAALLILCAVRQTICPQTIIIRI